jgi:hypothetical protein
MGADSNVAPVIIRKKKRQSGGHGHHGGAWKVAMVLSDPSLGGAFRLNCRPGRARAFAQSF